MEIRLQNSNTAGNDQVKENVKKRVSQIRNLSLNESTFPEIKLTAFSNSLLELFRNGNKLAFIGNGGSAAEAMHLAAEFTGKCVLDHRPLPAMCLNESQSALTAIANDYGVREIFSRQVEAHLVKDDVLIALTTSGSSENILHAIDKAIEIGVRVIVWTGEKDLSISSVEVWNVPSSSTPRVQEIHLAWGHIIAEAVESELQKI